MYVCYWLFWLGGVGCWLCYAQNCEPALDSWFAHLYLELLQQNIECVIWPEVTLWGSSLSSSSIVIYPLTARVVGAPQMISQPVFFFFCLFFTALWNLPNSRPVHSLMLSSHLFLCLPCLLPLLLLLLLLGWQGVNIQELTNSWLGGLWLSLLRNFFEYMI